MYCHCHLNFLIPIFTEIDCFYYIKLSFGAKILFPVKNNVIMKGMIFGLKELSLSGGLDEFMNRNFEMILWKPIDFEEKIILDMWNTSFLYGY